MSGKLRRVDFYPADWLAGTIGLSVCERGLYITALMLIYSNGGPVAIDDLRACCQREHGNMFNRLLGRLVELDKLTPTEDGKLDNRRCEMELIAAHKRLEKASENGARGNEIRHLRVATRSLSPSPSKEICGNTESLLERKGSGEGECEPIGSSGLPHGKPAKNALRKRRVAVPDNWQPDLDQQEFAQAKAGWGPAECEEAALAFRTHHLAKGTLFRDLDAGWQAWVLTGVRLRAQPTRGARSNATEDYGYDRATWVGMPTPEEELDFWRRFMTNWLNRGGTKRNWLNGEYGAPPGEWGCRVPAAILAEFGWATT